MAKAEMKETVEVAMLTDLTKIDCEAIIKQEACAVKKDASVHNGHEMQGERLACFCNTAVECAKAGKCILLISLYYPVGMVLRKLLSICLNEPFPPGSAITPEKIEAVRNVVGDRILLYSPRVPDFSLKALDEVLLRHPETEIAAFDNITVVNRTALTSKDLRDIAVKHKMAVIT